MSGVGKYFSDCVENGMILAVGDVLLFDGELGGDELLGILNVTRLIVVVASGH